MREGSGARPEVIGKTYCPTKKSVLNKLLAKNENKNLHPRVRVDQAVRPLPPKTLSILVGLQCVTASKKLTYKKLQADFFEKLYSNIRN